MMADFTGRGMYELRRAAGLEGWVLGTLSVCWDGCMFSGCGRVVLVSLLISA